LLLAPGAWFLWHHSFLHPARKRTEKEASPL
jgi:hypothetical protein